MAGVAIAKTCPTCGAGTITYAGEKFDKVLTAGCYVCKGTFTTGNPEYTAIEVTKCPNCGYDKAAQAAPDTGETVNPDTGETVNPDQPPTSGTGK